MTMTDAERWERSARFWMRAYPRRWRMARGEELLGVLLDLAAPGARRVGGRTALDLLLGGWATRLREHPPLGAWLAYRSLSRRLPVRYRAWAADDIAGALFGARRFGWFPGLWWPYISIATGTHGVRGALGLFALSVVAAGSTSSFRDRRRALLKHVDPQHGELIYGGRLVVVDGPRSRVEARSGLRVTALASALLAVCVVVVMGFAALGGARAPRSILGATADRAPVIGALLLGVVLLAGISVLHLRRRLPAAVDQPHRVLHPVAVPGLARGSVALVSWGAFWWLAITEWFGSTWSVAAVVGLVLAAVALVFLVGAVTGLVGLRRHGAAGLALVDVLRAMAPGRPSPVDGPVPALGPASAGVPHDSVHVAPTHPALPA